jgi:hypothetical protein
VKAYMTMKEKVSRMLEVSGEIPDIHMTFVPNPDLSVRIIEGNVVGRNSSTPTYNDVAVMFDTPADPQCTKRLIRVDSKDDKPQSLDSYSSVCDLTCYTLLYPMGVCGCQFGIRYDQGRKKLSMRRFYLYKLHERVGFVNTILHGGLISLHFIVDIFFRIDGDRLMFIRSANGQEIIRAETYYGLLDQFNNRAARDNTELGRYVIHREPALYGRTISRRTGACTCFW